MEYVENYFQGETFTKSRPNKKEIKECLPFFGQENIFWKIGLEEEGEI